jgi:hypothetical protein
MIGCWPGRTRRRGVRGCVFWVGAASAWKPNSALRPPFTSAPSAIKTNCLRDHSPASGIQASGFLASDSVTLDFSERSDSVTPMPRTDILTVKQLHDDTGPSVRRAGASKRPIPITDRGELVAVLAHPALVRPQPRRRVLLPEYEAMMAAKVGGGGSDIQDALNEIRGDR